MKTKARGLLYVLVGPLADPKRLARWAHEEFKQAGAVAFIGVDGGMDALAAAELPPTLAIGDFDGIKNKRLLDPENVGTSIRLPAAKDRSDLAYAIEFCRETGADTLYAYGFQGGRPDHDFAVHLELAEASLKIPRVVSLGELGVVFYLSARHAPAKRPFRVTQSTLEFLAKSATARAPKKRRVRIVSVFPIGGPAYGVRYRGLRFPVAGGILSLSSQGLSNEVRAREVAVDLKRGQIALFFPV